MDDLRYDPDLRSKELRIDEMAYEVETLGQHPALLITSNIIRHRILESVVKVLDQEYTQIESSVFPIDNLIELLLCVIRQKTTVQNTHLLYCTRW